MKFGKWMVPVTSTNGKQRKKWKTVDVLISSATKQPMPSHTYVAAGFVSILLSPAFKALESHPDLQILVHAHSQLKPSKYPELSADDYPCKFPYY